MDAYEALRIALASEQGQPAEVHHARDSEGTGEGSVKSASEQLKEGSEAMKVNVYAGRGNWFALTDKRVAALPSDRGPWALMSTVNLERGEMELRLGVVTEEVLDTIKAGQVYFVERPISVDVTRTSRG